MTSLRYHLLSPAFGTTVIVPPRVSSEQLAFHAWRMYLHGGAAAEPDPHVWEQLDRALERDSACALAHYFKAVLLECTGRPEDARLHLDRARELDPDKREAERALAMVERFGAGQPC